MADCHVLVDHDQLEQSSQQPVGQQLPDYYSSIPNASEIVSALRIPIRVFDGTTMIRLEETPPTYDEAEYPEHRAYPTDVITSMELPQIVQTVPQEPLDDSDEDQGSPSKQYCICTFIMFIYVLIVTIIILCKIWQFRNQ